MTEEKNKEAISEPEQTEATSVDQQTEDQIEELTVELSEEQKEDKSKEQKAALSPKKTPLILKILSVLLILSSVVFVPLTILVIVTMALEPIELTNELGMTTFVVSLVLVISSLLSSVVGALLGINLLRNKRRFARQLCDIMIAITIVSLLCDLMLGGIDASLINQLVTLVVLIAVGTYIDPALSDERKIQRHLRKLEARKDKEEGTLGRDESGKGYIKLDFFNIFWIFVIGCLVGVVIETIYHIMLYGEYQNRTGMLFGPFSPIYGFGALLMTIALNRFYKKPVILIFFVTAIIGGAFEYAVSWFLQLGFGIVAWDYTGTFMSIDGRTNGVYMFMWGVLGCIWIKFLLPYVLKLVNLIPWNWRYVITSVCAVAMLANGILTLAALDSWYERLAGQETTSALSEFCNEHFDNDFMENRFQSMTIDPDNSTRVSS